MVTRSSADPIGVKTRYLCDEILLLLLFFMLFSRSYAESQGQNKIDTGIAGQNIITVQ